MHFSLQHLVVSFLLGIVVAAFGVYYLLDKDGGLIKAKERRKEVTTLIKHTKKEDFAAIKRQKKEVKPIEKKIRKINKNLKNNSNPTERLALQKEKIAILEEENELLKKHKAELILRLEAHHKAEKEALSVINANLLELQREKAKNKAFVIGMGVGLPLAITAGIVAGFYLPIKK